MQMTDNSELLVTGFLCMKGSRDLSKRRTTAVFSAAVFDKIDLKLLQFLLQL